MEKQKLMLDKEILEWAQVPSTAVQQDFHMEVSYYRGACQYSNH